jgi:hypothetical protein
MSPVLVGLHWASSRPAAKGGMVCWGGECRRGPRARALPWCSPCFSLHGAMPTERAQFQLILPKTGRRLLQPPVRARCRQTRWVLDTKHAAGGPVL